MLAAAIVALIAHVARVGEVLLARMVL